MKNFTYHSAKDSKEATKLSSSNSAFLAGGMTTIPSMKLGLASYKDIIDIKKITGIQSNLIFLNKTQKGHYDKQPKAYKKFKTFNYYRKNTVNFKDSLKELIQIIKSNQF